MKFAKGDLRTSVTGNGIRGSEAISDPNKTLIAHTHTTHCGKLVCVTLQFYQPEGRMTTTSENSRERK